MAHEFTVKHIKAARRYAERYEKRFTDGDFELVDDPVLRTGDDLGVWVPCRVFVRWEALEDVDAKATGE